MLSGYPARLSMLIILATGLAACSSETRLDESHPPKTLIDDYSVEIVGAPDDDFTEIAEEALQLYRLKEDGVQSRAFLLRRARGDVPTLQKLLRSRGFYEGRVDAALLPEATDTEPGVVITVTPGPQYTLASHRFVGPGGTTLTGIEPARLGSPLGKAAAAVAILSSEDAAIATLRRDGHAYARFLQRDAVADAELKTIEVVSVIAPGRRYRMNLPQYSGVTAVDESYLESYRTYEQGEVYDETRLRDFQRRLQATGLFNAVRVEPPKRPPGSPSLPIVVTVEERKPRTVALGLRYDTSDGPETYARLTHRNLLGRNEEATAEIETGLIVQQFTVRFRKPQFLRNEQALVAALELERDTGEAYDGLTAKLTFGVERRLSERWTAGAGLLTEVSSIRDQGIDQNSVLAGIPVFVVYDGTDDPLDPGEGQRLRLEATPFGGQFDASPLSFLQLDATASAYFALNRKGNLVLAVRGRLASIVGAPLDRIPSHHRLYSGGGGSVRGYARDLIGPLDRFNDPLGGRSTYELGIELRSPIWHEIGGALFFEAGSVSPDSTPDFTAPLQFSAGVGLRYASPVGPLRFDVGVPLNPRRNVDDPLQVYLAIGQAF